ncbi:hypothetical protein EYZ11_009942 [Aspergillus tanneri]|uniref:Uncharacterized protein n=1 Tax=Aspergillus tanneri TaxID=1220188 RepID=A0A4V3UNB9_9EURO|nr:hypothetical protein EYZ11_009942 [Aspergillus tanneri]
MPIRRDEIGATEWYRCSAEMQDRDKNLAPRHLEAVSTAQEERFNSGMDDRDHKLYLTSAIVLTD